MKTIRLVQVVAVVTLLLSVSILSASMAVAKPQNVFKASATPTRPPFPSRQPGESGRDWARDVLHWVSQLLDWLGNHLHLHFPHF